MCYSITDRKSFECVVNWMTQIESISPKTSKIILIGNKKDMEEGRAVSAEEGKEFARKHDIPFFETSAFTGENVNLAFETLGRKIMEVLNEIGNDSDGWLIRKQRADRGKREEVLWIKWKVTNNLDSIKEVDDRMLCF